MKRPDISHRDVPASYFDHIAAYREEPLFAFNPWALKGITGILMAMAFPSVHDGWIVGSPQSAVTQILATTNGDQSWHPQFRYIMPGPTNGVSFVTSQLGYGIGSVTNQYVVQKTEDGGITWKTVGTLPSLPNQDPFTSLSFVNPNMGVALSPQGPIAKTVNGDGVGCRYPPCYCRAPTSICILRVLI